jgi:hypothetical protein
MTDPLFLTVLVCIATACLLSYLLGRYHGVESAFTTMRRSEETAGDWADPYLGLTANDLEGLHGQRK